MALHNDDYAVQSARRELEMTAHDAFSRSTSLDKLADKLLVRYSHFGRIQDLEEAISIGRQAIQSTFDEDPYMPRFLNNLAVSLFEKARVTGSNDALDEGIRLIQRAIAINEDGATAALLSNLGVHLGIRYSRAGAMDDLNEAIEMTRQSISLTEMDAETPGRLNNLAMHLGSKYLSTGSMSELDEAIQLARRSSEGTPADDPEKAVRFNNLGIRIYNRYSRIGAMDDLDEAIRVLGQAVDSTTGARGGRAMFLNNMSCMLGSKYARTNCIDDLGQSISIAREAVAATPDGHQEKASRRNNLANQLGTRFLRTQDPKDVEEAIALTQDAVSNLDDAHPDKPRWSSNLALHLCNRYLKKRELADLDEVIKILWTVVKKLPRDHLDRTNCLHNLGIQLKRRFSALKETADLEQAISVTREAMDNPRSLTISRALCGGLGIELCALKSDWPQATEIARRTIPLIPRLSSRSLTNADKQNMLSRPYGLACNAAGVALYDQNGALTALQFLEQGRAVIADSLDALRTDVTALQHSHSALATEFIKMQEELDIDSTRNLYLRDGTRTAPWEVQADRRHAAGKEFDALVAEIREQPGFGDFLGPATEEEMKAAAKHGAIIVINVSDYRCDAILVEHQEIRCLPLPRLDKKEVQENARGDLGSTEILEWLWDVVAQPVLEYLGFTKPASSPNLDEWPRIWWVPTGPLSKFPLHAAGYHEKGSSETVMDRVVSSYSSSIKALIHGRKRHRRMPTPSAPAEALLVAMEHTVGASHLPNAAAEVGALYNPLREMSFHPFEPGRRDDDVKPHLPNCNIFHFAGHGYTEESDPSKSHLVLDGKDGRSSLTVETLFNMNLRDRSPFLAYLSACGTGRIKEDKFVDESIHLISAFQLAGFRHVIGTLWEVADENCVHIAKTTYENMRDGAMTDESVCRGLHRACRNLRDRWLGLAPGNDHEMQSGASTTSGDGRTTDINSVSSLTSEIIHPPRNFISDDKESKSAHWAPYVHFGV